MTKNLLVTFLSVFMLKATITAAHNTDLNADEQMTGLSRYSISTVSVQYQSKIEGVFRGRQIPYSQETFAQNTINYAFLQDILGTTVPDEIAYGDTGGKDRNYFSVSMHCPNTPKKGFSVYRETDRAWAWKYTQCRPTYSSTAQEELVPVVGNLDQLFAQQAN